MDEACAAAARSPRAAGNGVFQGLGPGQRFGPGQQRIQPCPSQVLHQRRSERPRVFSDEVDLCGDVGMAQPGLARGALTLERSTTSGSWASSGARIFDGHRAFQRRCRWPVRYTAPMPSAAEQTDDLEVLEPRAFQRVDSHPGLGFSRAF